MPLTVPQIKAAAAHKPTKLHDSEGLFLLVKPSGAKLWRWKFYFHGRERLMALGSFPEVSLKDARESRDAARVKVRAGIDPVAERRAPQLAAASAVSLDELAELYLADNPKKVGARTLRIHRARLARWVSPKIGRRAARTIEPADMLALLRSIESTGKIETAVRVRELCGRTFRYGIGEKLCDRDPTRDLDGLLQTPIATNRPAITDPRQVGALMRAIRGYEGQPSTMFALRLIGHVFLRPGELRGGRWSEIDWDAALWRVPGPRMKMGRDHLVPLSRQALAILRELYAVTGDTESDLMFPAIGSARRPISENTLNGALRRLGYDTKAQHCAHGFRSTASSLLHELGHDHAVIELQLGHAKSNKVSAAYDRSARLGDRVKLMQAWSDHLDALVTGGRVVSLHRRRASRAGSAA